MESSSNRVGIKKEESIYIYILRLVDGTHYTGITNDLERRMEEHRTGQSKSTKFKLPVKGIFVTKVGDRLRAREVEVQIKRRGAKRWLNDLRFKNTKYDFNKSAFIDDQSNNVFYQDIE